MAKVMKDDNYRAELEAMLCKLRKAIDANPLAPMNLLNIAAQEIMDEIKRIGIDKVKANPAENGDVIAVARAIGMQISVPANVKVPSLHEVFSTERPKGCCGEAPAVEMKEKE